MHIWSQDEIRKSLRLYAVSDRSWLRGRSLAQCIEEALRGGVSFVQLREKNASYKETLKLAYALKPICAQYQVPFVVDDNVELAYEVQADGVHVGQSDMACARAREILGPHAIVGVSVQTTEQALAAQAAGASYLGVGALIATPTKPDAEIVSYEQLSAICEAVDIPVVGIGGLNEHTISSLKGYPIDGVALVSALFASDDCKAAAKALRCVVEESLALNARQERY